MAANVTKKIREIAEAQGNPRDTLLRAVGDISKEIVLHSQILIATYIRPERTAGGIILTDRAIEEDRFQGSIGLVLAKGPGAFKDDNIAKFHGQTVEVGDWVLFRPADGLALFINEVPCRLFEDAHLKMKVTRPEIYW